VLLILEMAASSNKSNQYKRTKNTFFNVGL
jgi:hypothetical protein